MLTDDADAARRAFHEELELCRELVVPPIASEALIGFAALAVGEDDPQRAARLLGAADAHSYGMPQDDIVRVLDELFFGPARAKLGLDAWHGAVRAGSELSLDAACRCALRDAKVV